MECFTIIIVVVVVLMILGLGIVAICMKGRRGCVGIEGYGKN